MNFILDFNWHDWLYYLILRGVLIHQFTGIPLDFFMDQAYYKVNFV